MKWAVRAMARLGLLLSATCISGVAHAADVDNPEQKAAAQALFERGRALVEQGQFAQACPKLAESQRLDPGIGTLLWLADCYESIGRTASAWASFKEAAATAALRHDERERVARERATALEPRLSRLAITVAPGGETRGLAIQRDETEIGSAEWGLALPLDPGVHTVAAHAPGRRSWSMSVDVPANGGTVPVTVPALPLTTETQGERASRDALAGLHPQPVKGAGQRIAGATMAGVGLAGLVAGTVVSFKAKSTYDQATASGHCLADNECDAAGKSSRKDAYSLAAVATIVMSAGVVGVAGGAVLFFTAPHPGAPAIAFVPSRRGLTARVEWSW
jgi:serine/threonine-protein kinase